VIVRQKTAAGGAKRAAGGHNLTPPSRILAGMATAASAIPDRQRTQHFALILAVWLVAAMLSAFDKLHAEPAQEMSRRNGAG
jgi:hypothetical protein